MAERGEGKADVANDLGGADINPVIRQSVAELRLFQNVLKKGRAKRSALLSCDPAIVPFWIQLIAAMGVEVGRQPLQDPRPRPLLSLAEVVLIGLGRDARDRRAGDEAGDREPTPSQEKQNRAPPCGQFLLQSNPKQEFPH